MTVERPAYDLLPVIDRIRDAEQGLPLQALLGLVESELQRLHDDVDGLYENGFIETCAEWVVPYLGDLLGVPALRPVPGTVASQRAFVANTIRYRRRKGTAAILEQLARDVTGWPARVVEYFRLLSVTQHLDHVRLDAARTADLRGADALELLDTSLDQTAHTADVRHIDVGRGRLNIPNVGIHLWRLGAYAVSGVDAARLDRDRGRWTFDPAGRDLRLFNRPVTEPDVTRLAGEGNLPGPIRRRWLEAELRRRRSGAASAVPEPWIGPAERCLPTPPADDGSPALPLAVRLDDATTPENLICCNLADWRRPGGTDRVAVDPVLGRLTLAPGLDPSRVRVDYAYGFPGDVGAGPHDRRPTLAAALSGADLPWPEVTWQVGVTKDGEPVPGRIVRTLGEAVRLWATRPTAEPGDVGVIAVLDSATYPENVSVTVPAGNRLLIVAAGWPERPDASGAPVRDAGSYVASGLRPHLAGTVTVTGDTTLPGAPTELAIDGLSIAGAVTVVPGRLTSLVVADTTVIGDGWIRAASHPDPAVRPGLTIRLLRTVAAGLTVPGARVVTLTDTILYDDAGTTLAAPAADTHFDAGTVLGTTVARTLTASNTIFTRLVRVARRQVGCVRYCYLPLDSVTPRRFRCLPADADDEKRLAPTFTSRRPADPGFGQLARNCPAEFRTGADDEGELGAYHFLQQQRRLANLRTQLDHYLRFGLEAGVFFTT